MLKYSRTHPVFIFLGTMIVALGGTLLLPFLWQELTLADFGLLASIDLFMAFGGVLVGLQQESSLNRLYYTWDEDAERNRNISTLVTISFVSLVAFGGLLLTAFDQIAMWLLPGKASHHRDILSSYLIFLILSKNRGMLNAFLRVTKHAFDYFLYNTIGIAIQIILVVALVFNDHRGLSGYILALLISEGVVVFYALTLMYTKTGFSFVGSTARLSLRFALPLIPAALFSSGLAVIERFFLLMFTPLSDLGLYATCQRVASVIPLVNNSFKMIFAPRAFEMVENKESKYTISLYRNNFFYYILLLSIVALPSMPLFAFLSGADEYIKATTYFPIFVLIGLCTAAYPYFCSGAFFSKHTRYSSYPSLIELSSFAVFVSILGSALGLLGVAVARLGATGLMVATGYWISQRTYPLPLLFERKINYALLMFLVSIMLFYLLQ